MRQALKGSGTRYGQIVAQIVANLAPEELSPIVRRGDTERLAERTGIGEDQGERIIDHPGTATTPSGSRPWSSPTSR